MRADYYCELLQDGSITKEDLCILCRDRIPILTMCIIVIVNSIFLIIAGDMYKWVFRWFFYIICIILPFVIANVKTYVLAVNEVSLKIVFIGRKGKGNRKCLHFLKEDVYIKISNSQISIYTRQHKYVFINNIKGIQQQEQIQRFRDIFQIHYPK